MPTPQPLPFTTGTVMDSAAVAIGVSDARDYLNGEVIDSDFDDEGIGFEDLLRPVLLGYPFLTFDGEFQGSTFRTSGLGDDQAPMTERGKDPPNSLIAREVERGSIFPKIVDLNDRQVVPGSSVRFDVDVSGTADVLLTAKLEAVVLGVGPEFCGIVKLYYRNTTDDPAGSGTALEGSKRNIYRPMATTQYQMTEFSFASQFTVTPGTYDVWLGYTLGASTTNNAQIIASGTTLGVELHVTGPG